MSKPLKFITFVASFGALAFGAFFLTRPSAELIVINTVATTTQSAALGSLEAPVPQATTTSAMSTPKKEATSTVATAAKPSPAPATPAHQAIESKENQAIRIQDPYAFDPLSFDSINESARAALVNILCIPHSGSLRPISGSGVIIDPRGVILTNAHVAQYVLLSQSSQIDLACLVRTGAPARSRFTVETLYIPPVWVNAHVQDINTDRPVGTGEHDYALLRITGSIDGSAIGPLPYLPTDTREAIGFTGDQVLAASYPAEFLGGIAATNSLYPASSITSVKQLLTFTASWVDLLSLGGVIEAQSGSSGGAVVNAWGRLVGLIATTSGGDTTAARDLRAITLSYIDRDLQAQRGTNLQTILNGDVAADAADFNAGAASALIQRYIEWLSR